MSRRLEFTKMHGAGNDFVVLDGRGDDLPALEPLARRLLDRRFGIGGDQLLVVRPSSVADARMDIHNPDGSRAEMCANGIRAFAKWLLDRGVVGKEALSVETLAGVVHPRRVAPDRFAVDMGRPVLAPAKIPTRLGSGEGPVVDASLELEGERLRVSCVSMGNPHCVLWVADVDAAPVDSLGPRIEHHEAFPNRVNVEFVQLVSRGRVRQRTWERGTGETLACGSGACAVAVAGVLGGRTARAVTIELRGGELEIAWPDDAASVVMTGPAAEVFRGQIPLEGG